MLCIKIELWKRGNPNEVEEIGRMYIANDGTSRDPKIGNYTVAVCRRGSIAVPQGLRSGGPSPVRAGTVKSYPRLSYNVWRLIARALLAAFPEER